MVHVIAFFRWCLTTLGMSLSLAALAILALTGWILFGGSLRPDNSKDPYIFMHCPKCGLEIPYNPELVTSPCLKCGKSRYVATREKIGEEAAGYSTTSKLIVLAIVLLVVVQGVVYIWIIDSRIERVDPGDKLKCRCPTCKRKFAYSSRLSGTVARCSRCKSEFELPASE